MKKSQMLRIVAFDSLVRKGDYPNSANFSADYEVSTRTVMRDIEYLKYQLEAPLEYDAEKRGYYYMHDWDLPAVVKMHGIIENRSFHIIEQIKALDEKEAAMVADYLARQRLFPSYHQPDSSSMAA